MSISAISTSPAPFTSSAPSSMAAAATSFTLKSVRNEEIDVQPSCTRPRKSSPANIHASSPTTDPVHRQGLQGVHPHRRHDPRQNLPLLPQSNGKMERWYKTVKGECIRVTVPLSLDDARRIVTDYVAHYNDVRSIAPSATSPPTTGCTAVTNRSAPNATQAGRSPRTPQAHSPARARTPTAAARRSAHASGAAGHRLRRRPRRRHHGRGPRSARLPTADHPRRQQRGPCPLHGSSTGTSRVFSVNLADQIFHCFKCGRSGNASTCGSRPPAKPL